MPLQRVQIEAGKTAREEAGGSVADCRGVRVSCLFFRRPGYESSNKTGRCPLLFSRPSNFLLHLSSPPAISPLSSDLLRWCSNVRRASAVKRRDHPLFSSFLWWRVAAMRAVVRAAMAAELVGEGRFFLPLPLPYFCDVVGGTGSRLWLCQRG